MRSAPALLSFFARSFVHANARLVTEPAFPRQKRMTKTPPPRWEYYLHTANVEGGVIRDMKVAQGLHAEMNDLGRSGWELVSALDLNLYEGRSAKVVLLFKRPLPG
jgi:hypothetical protein